MRMPMAICAALLLAACAANEPAEPALSPGIDTAELSNQSSFAPGSQEALRAEAGDTIFFAFDSASIRPESQAVLRQQAAWLQQNPGVSITVAGHTDERGTREYNLALGARRADAVRTFLLGLGLDGNRVRTLSYGEERPAVGGTGERIWAQNRRAVTMIGFSS